MTKVNEVDLAVNAAALDEMNRGMVGWQMKNKGIDHSATNLKSYLFPFHSPPADVRRACHYGQQARHLETGCQEQSVA